MTATHALAVDPPHPPGELPLLAATHPANIGQHRAGLTQAGLLDTVGVLLDVVLPTFSKGVIIRRPAVEGLAERWELDRRAVRRLQRLRARHGTAPLMLKLPLRKQAVLLDPAHVHTVLQGTPSPFSPASAEKRAALSHFQPKGSLISEGCDRAVRRRFNEDALGHQCPVHPMAAHFLGVVEDEAFRLARIARAQRGVLAWPEFGNVWARVVRRVIFGQGAANDWELAGLMTRLRQQANWAFMAPQRDALRDQLHARLAQHLQRAEPGSLAHTVAAMPVPASAEPLHQIPQWLFAFDPAGMTAARTLALLAAHSEVQQAACEEAGRRDAADLPFLRACALEALRLWPTTPAILRQTDQDTVWDGDIMPAGTGILIFAPFFHRDDETLPHADRFTPELWLGERTTADWPLMPFSEGPGVCPGRHLVLMIVSAMVAALIRHAGPVRLEPPHRLDARQPLPGTLNHFSLRFRFGA